MNTAKLKDKVAIITGSSMGIGKAIAIALAKEQVKVVLNGRNLQRLENTATELSTRGFDVFSVQGDVSNYSDCEKLVAQTMRKYGHIDILINNAGIAMEGRIEDTSPEVFEKVFNVNILGVLFPTKAALPYLKDTKGSIVFTSSIAGFMGLPEYSAYSSSKMALTALAQSLKIELMNTGIHVGINYVGFAENDINKTFLNKNGELEKMPIRKQFKRMPLEQVAAIFVEGIKKRKYKQTLSVIGKLTKYFQTYFPGIFEKAMLIKYKKQNK